MSSKRLYKLNATVIILITLSVSLSGANAETGVGQATRSVRSHSSILNLTSENITELVSVSSNGIQGNDWSWQPSLSADGRFVVFSSRANNLVPGDTNDYCIDEFTSETVNCVDIFVHDRLTGQTERVSISSDEIEGNGDSLDPEISDDGRYVVFTSHANNLVSDDTNEKSDIFIHDRITKKTEIISISSFGEDYGGSTNPSISGDGRYVTFLSDYFPKSPWCQIIIHDYQTKLTKCVDFTSDGNPWLWYSGAPSISADGRYIAFSASDISDGLFPPWYSSTIFVYDRLTEIIEFFQIETCTYISCSFPSISADGRFIAFYIADSINVLDRKTGQKKKVGYGRYEPAISNNGRYIVFPSPPVHSDNGKIYVDILLYDRYSGMTEVLSHTPNGGLSNGDSYQPSISGMGEFIAFSSEASNLVNGDTNEAKDIFIHQPSSDVKMVFLPITTLK